MIFGNVLQPQKVQGISFTYDNSSFGTKLKVVPQPKRQPKIKTLISPELHYNPVYNELQQQIASGNLQELVKEGYSEVKYHPISSTGLRAYSSLNSRTNGIKQRFQDVKVTLCAYDKDCQNTNCIYLHSTISKAIRNKFSTPKKEVVVIQEPLKRVRISKKNPVKDSKLICTICENYTTDTRQRLDEHKAFHNKLGEFSSSDSSPVESPTTSKAKNNLFNKTV